MGCESYLVLMTGYLDGELSADDKSRFLKHLEGCGSCEEEFLRHRQLKEITGSMRFIEPEDRVWTAYWSSVYNRLERKAAWILISVGSILLLSYATFHLLEGMLLQEGISWGIRAGVISLIVGGYTLLASIIRERLAVHKSDRYKDVKR